MSKMNLINFFCNLGGLLGMWLGLSLFGLFNSVINIINKINSLKYVGLIKLKLKRIFDFLKFKCLRYASCFGKLNSKILQIPLIQYTERLVKLLFIAIVLLGLI